MKIAISLSLALLLPILAACQSKLPEEGSPDAKLYAERCGSCHKAYSPGSLTPGMWDAMMKSMDERIRKSGLPPLTPQQYKTILDYLSRNAE